MESAEKITENLEKENRLLREQVRAAQNRFEDKIAELSLIRELSMGLLHVRNFERACDFILDTIINNTTAQNCSIMLLDHDKHQLFLVSATDLEGNKFTLPAENIFSKKGLRYSFKYGQGAAGYAMADKKPVVIHDTSQSPYFDSKHKNRINIGSLLAVPLLVKNEPVGVLNLSHADPNAFETGDVNLFHITANYVAISLQNTLNYEKLEIEIAKRKQVEKALRKVHQDLEVRIQERTGDLAEANEQLKNEIRERKAAQAEALEAKERAELANRAKSEFLANMSHEIRTPLHHIIGFTDVLLDKHFGELNDQQTDYLIDIQKSSQHLLALINDILDLSKVEAGNIELELNEVDIHALLTESLNMIKEKALKHRIKLSTSINGLPDFVQLDERKMKQILYNLLSNAAKFTPDGGEMVLSAETTQGIVRAGQRWNDARDKEVFECLAQNQDIIGGMVHQCIRVSVADTGIGISKSNQSRIFNAFEQIDGSSDPRRQGTGLGLSLTRKLIELHGGKIWVESKGEGKGTTFSFVIPIQHLKNADHLDYE